MFSTVTKNARTASRAFTLLELLCVVAIISLLCALILPSLQSAKMSATRVICRSNLSQYGIINSVYLDEFDNRFPNPQNWLYSMESDSPVHPIGCRWHDWPMALDGDIMNSSPEYRGMMWELISEMPQAICPDFRRYAKERRCENSTHNPAIDIKSQYNYTMNAYLGSDIQGSVKNIDEVHKPATKFIFGEENSWSVRPDHPKYPARSLKAPLSTNALDDTALLITPTPNAENCFGTFHGNSDDLSDGSGNLVFLDGHVSSISVEEQLRKNMHGFTGQSRSSLYRYERGYEEKEFHPAGNLWYAWPHKDPPPGGWDGQ